MPYPRIEEIDYERDTARRVSAGSFPAPMPVFKLPVYLDEEVEPYLAKKAEAEGVELSDLVNELLKKEIEIVEPVK
jgi:hypothetical protein